MRSNRGRIKLDVPVAVIVQGKSDTRVFPARTIDASAYGARFAVPSGQLSTGQTVTVSYRQKECCFRVAWVGAIGSPWENHVGMECLQKCKNFWDIEFQEFVSFSLDALRFPWENVPHF